MAVRRNGERGTGVESRKSKWQSGLLALRLQPSACGALACTMPQGGVRGSFPYPQGTGVFRICHVFQTPLLSGKVLFSSMLDICVHYMGDLPPHSLLVPGNGGT